MAEPALGGGSQVERQIGRAEVIAKVAGGVVHNFNNILAVLLGRVDLLLGQVDSGRIDPAELRHGLLSVQKAAKDAADLLKRLRDLTRPPQDVDAAFDLNAAVLDAVAFIQPHVATVSQTLGIALELTPRLTTDPTLISGQSSALREVLVNLLLNAIEAMPRGGDLGIETRRDGAWVMLQITDSGIGMSDEVLAQIFTPFFTTKGTGSTGLGLSSARDLIVRHGGSISVRSRIGQGASFTIRLPLTEGAVESAGSLTEPEIPVGLSVLVVEDDPALGDLLREFLEAKGCRVTLAGAGKTALDEVARRPYDVVLVDLLRPGARGWDIARAGKRHSPRTAVILMSGEMNPENPWADGQAIDATVTKPLDLRKLLRVIVQVASRRAPHQVE